MAPKHARPPRAAHEHLHRLLDGTHPPRAYHWHHVLAMVHEVSATRTPAHERVLRRAAEHDGRFELDPRSGMPHAMPPEEMVRCLAVRQLARWDRQKHAAVIRRAVARSDHERVAHEAAGVIGSSDLRGRR